MFIIGRRDPSDPRHTLVMHSAPARHTTIEKASEEARRLARIHTGYEFIVLQAVLLVKVAEAPVSVTPFKE